VIPVALKEWGENASVPTQLLKPRAGNLVLRSSRQPERQNEQVYRYTPDDLAVLRAQGDREYYNRPRSDLRVQVAWLKSSTIFASWLRTAFYTYGLILDEPCRTLLP
jgi:hypothetical protein